VRWGGMRDVAAKEEEGKRNREEGHELGVRGWHAITLAVHLC
jgi:hypothetical protein